MKFKHLTLAVLFATILTGCGDVEWFPEPKPEDVPMDTVTTLDSGTYTNSLRSGEGWIVTTSRGAFATYTSMRVPAGTPTYMDTHFDTQTKAELGKVLRAQTKSILIREVLLLL